eukprot:scaffold14657_cov28-Phaeocystis_antarctica.AAC.1
MCPSLPGGARTAPGRALSNLPSRAPTPYIGECAAGRHSRSPGRTGTIPGASDIYKSQTARSCSSLRT